MAFILIHIVPILRYHIEIPKKNAVQNCFLNVLVILSTTGVIEYSQSYHSDSRHI